MQLSSRFFPSEDKKKGSLEKFAGRKKQLLSSVSNALKVHSAIERQVSVYVKCRIQSWKMMFHQKLTIFLAAAAVCAHCFCYNMVSVCNYIQENYETIFSYKRLV